MSEHEQFKSQPPTPMCDIRDSSTTEERTVEIRLGLHHNDVFEINHEELCRTFDFFANRDPFYYRLICKGDPRDVFQWHLVEQSAGPEEDVSSKPNDEHLQNAIQLYGIMLQCVGPALRKYHDCNECDFSRLHRQNGRYAAKKIAELLVRHGRKEKTARYFLGLVMVVNRKIGSETDANFMSDSPQVWTELLSILESKVALWTAVGMRLNQDQPNGARLLKEEFRPRKIDTGQVIHYEGILFPGGRRWKQLRLLLVFFLSLWTIYFSCCSIRDPWLA